MTKSTGGAFISGALAERIKKIPTIDKSYTTPGPSGMTPAYLGVIENFGIFIDTHRDQPHVGTFHDDIHRGFCRPTKVDYVVPNDWLVNQETGARLDRHDKHLFVEEDWYSQFVVAWMMEHGGAMPFDSEGMMPTSHLRDPRAKTYLLRSFRQMAMYHYNKVRT